MLASLFIFFYFSIISPYFEIIQQNPISLAHRPLIPTVLILLMILTGFICTKLRSKTLEEFLISVGFTFFALPHIRYVFWAKTPWICVGLIIVLFFLIRRVSKKYLFTVTKNSLAGIFLVFSMYEVGSRFKEIVPGDQPLTQFVTKEGKSSNPDIYHFIIDSAAVQNEALIQKLFPYFTYYPKAVSEFGQTIYSLRSLFSGVNVRDEVGDLKIKHVPFEKTFLKKLEDRYSLTTNIQVVSDLPSTTSFFYFRDLKDPELSEFKTSWYDFLNYIQAYHFLYFPFDRESYFLNVMPTVYKKEMNFLKNFPVSTPGGRYFLIHFITPHPPGYLNQDCELGPFLKRGSYDDQYSCLMNTLSQILKKKEFDSSVVLIHGDHGHSDQTKDRHRPLLLLKRPFQKAFELNSNLISIQDIPLLLKEAGVSFEWRAADKPQFFYHNIGHVPERGFSRWEITPNADLKLLELKLGTYPMDKWFP